MGDLPGHERAVPGTRILHPVGLNLYVVQGIAPQIPVRDILLGTLPYVGVLAVGIVTLILVPDIVVWLPNQMFGGAG